jgi:hypothetical protein
MMLNKYYNPKTTSKVFFLGRQCHRRIETGFLALVMPFNMAVSSLSFAAAFKSASL